MSFQRDLTPYTKIKKGPVKTQELIKNKCAKHSNKNEKCVEIDIDPNFDFSDLSKRSTPPVFNTQIKGGSITGQASQDPFDYAASIFGTPGEWAEALGKHWCGPIPFPCWQVGLVGGGALLLILLLKR